MRVEISTKAARAYFTPASFEIWAAKAHQLADEISTTVSLDERIRCTIHFVNNDAFSQHRIAFDMIARGERYAVEVGLGPSQGVDKRRIRCALSQLTREAMFEVRE